MVFEEFAEIERRELLEKFFKNSGQISKHGFIVPPPISPACLAFRELQDTKGGQSLLSETLKQFKNGEIDKHGQKIKKGKKRKKTKKQA